MNLTLDEKRDLLNCLAWAATSKNATIKSNAARFWHKLNEEIERDEMKEQYEEAIIKGEEGEPYQLYLKRRKDHFMFCAGEYPTEDEARKAAAHFGDSDALIW